MNKKARPTVQPAPLTMLYDRILIEPIKSTKLPSGLYIPDTYKPDTLSGLVRACGPGLKNIDGKFIPLTVRPGDIVYYEKRYAVEIVIDAETFHVMPEGHAAGVKK